MKRFNTTGTCFPEQHYMVNIDRQVNAAAKLVRQGDYFCINRGRQYGKTTTLSALKTCLEKEGYAVFMLSFEGLEDNVYTGLTTMAATTLLLMKDCLTYGTVKNLSNEQQQILTDDVSDDTSSVTSREFKMLIFRLSSINPKTVLMVDEVDQSSNHMAFVQWLGMLRDMFLHRNERPTFQSVVLAGVYDIKNLKLKVRPEEHHLYNSPWNISVTFDEDMSLHAEGIANMLAEYKADHGLQFDEQDIAQMIYDYTHGYPFLVSRLCQIIDEQKYSWDKSGVINAVNTILTERNTLFDDMVKKIDQYPEFRTVLKNILYSGVRHTYNPDEKYIQIGSMFNIIRNDGGTLQICCRLMETRLYNLFLAEEMTSQFFMAGMRDKNQFVHDGHMDMRHLIERFSVHFNETYRPGKDDKFVEENGRKIFLTYLRPIINGIGNYYCEAQTRDLTRTDVVVDYLGQQYVIELKIWRGNSYNERGEQQLADYLDLYHLNQGYMVSFCFNKNKKPGVYDVMIGNRTIVEAIV
ncbi:MAG: AAA-like domain-containing protein [Prevotella sp.]